MQRRRRPMVLGRDWEMQESMGRLEAEGRGNMVGAQYAVSEWSAHYEGGFRSRAEIEADTVVEYDEEDDGFMFTRTRSKKAKAAPAVQPPEQIIEEQPEHQPQPITVKKSRKKSAELLKPASNEKEQSPVKRRRSPRNSGESVPDAPILEVKKRRVKGANASTPKPEKVDQPPDTTRVDGENTQNGPVLEETVKSPVIAEKVQRQPVGRPRDGTKIALPFADTPIIRRNKEMRKGAETGHRRSSLGNRGRRASSLIDSGKSNGTPSETCNQLS